jgi:predicted dehydrogenase
MAPFNSSRRDFIKKIAASSAMAGLAPAALASPTVQPLSPPERPSFSPNDRIQLATIGMGIIGFVDTRTALDIPGVELVAAADCYNSRLTRAREVFGDDLFTTQDYREVLARSDVDAVIIATPDHWHAQMARDAMEAGKDVYLEKPMIHDIKEGPTLIDAQQQTGRVLQVGSQFASSVVIQKARELFESGAIGALNMIEARYNRNSALGAWQYSIPPNVSEEDIAWERFLGDAPDHAFDPVRFFRWRNYWDYGTGVAGDLFVHLLTIIHTITSSNGPTAVTSTGGLRFWTDGRDVPDVQISQLEYPDTENHPPFTLSMQVNFVDGSGGGQLLRFTGSDGAMTIAGNELSLTQSTRRAPSLDQLVEGYNSVRTFSESVQEEFIEAYKEEHADDVNNPSGMTSERTYQAPDGYNDRVDHFMNFFNAIRDDGRVFEDPTFGYRAAAPTLLCNQSYREGRRLEWDPDTMEVAS